MGVAAAEEDPNSFQLKLKLGRKFSIEYSVELR